MKKIMFILICWTFSHAIFAQDTLPAKATTGTKEINTLFGKDHGNCKIPIGYFIEASFGYTRFGHKSVFLPGISMGLILNHNWTVGMTGNLIGNPRGLACGNRP